MANARLPFIFFTFSSNEIYPSEKKKREKSHKATHFRVQTANGRSGTFAVRGKNKVMLNLSIFTKFCLLGVQKGKRNASILKNTLNSVYCFLEAKFVSATNVAQARKLQMKLQHFCNVSATYLPRLGELGGGA